MDDRMNQYSVVIDMGTFDAVLYESNNKLSADSYASQLQTLNPRYPVEISSSPRKVKEFFKSVEICDRLEI